MPLIYSKSEIVSDIVRLLDLKEPEAGIIRGALYVKFPFDLLHIVHRQLCLVHPLGIENESHKPKSEAEKHNIIKALAACDGHRTRTAVALHIGVRTLYRKIKQFDLL